MFVKEKNDLGGVKMIFNNKKGANLMLVVAMLVVVLVLVFVLIRYVGKGGKIINDASDDAVSYINWFNPSCDTDKDGIVNSEDICPCNHKDYLEQLYFAKDLEMCPFRKECVKKVDDVSVDRISACIQLVKDDKGDEEKEPSDEELWVYSMSLTGSNAKTCKNKLEKELGKAIEDKKKYPECKDDWGKFDIEKESFDIDYKCAQQILLPYSGDDKERAAMDPFTFNCLTNKEQCMTKIKDTPC